MRTKGAVLALLSLLAGGCIQAQRAIKVNADGGGTVVDSVKLVGMAAAMKEMGNASTAQAKVNREVDLKKKAAAQGLTFVSSETAADGAEKVTYSFSDIAKTSLKSSPEMPNESKDKPASAEKPTDLLSFRLARAGDRSTLTVVVPKPAEGAKKDAKKDAKKTSPEEQKQALSMMKGMLAGTKLSTVIEVNGKILKTTSPYVQESSVTLMELDFDQLDDQALLKLNESESDAPPSPAELKGLKGVKFSEGEIVIEFAKK